MSMLAALLYTQTMLLAAPAAATPALDDGGSEPSCGLRMQQGWCADPQFAGPWYCLARCTGQTEFYVADAQPLVLTGDWEGMQADCYLKAVNFCTTALSQYLDRSCLGGAVE
ncbi:hypothetical protein SAMN02745121_01147 [Nannocystis exedens]|uniref:Secreted protein n=1 Tax=Nannocystis exedens TaxID=54 RepID=A0A1I1UIG6_9BACT|nr:hypothetical protein [Nannocystis exedens]PCC71603.1 hypothetical protein NAEX_04680 [Nannocystis exedens]SFD68543.1 hypothetical protein SAMN02745121_01147 [Nannocystis exedens]